MGYAIETVVGSLTAAATATAQPYIPGNGQSFNVRALAPNSVAHIEAVWANSTDVGFPRIRSPRLHDDVVGTEFLSRVGDVVPPLNPCFSEEVYSQDSLTVEDLFVAAPTVGHIEQIGYQIYYDDLPGVAANMQPWSQVESAIQSYYGVYVTPESNATVGEWGVGVAINSSQDNFKANSYYAWLGYEVSVNSEITAVAMQGTDIGNLFVGGPGTTDGLVTRNWFPYQEEANGKPSIPVINSQNKGATLVQVFANVASTAYEVSLIFAYLGPTGA
jgi:hypothetical protein